MTSVIDVYEFCHVCDFGIWGIEVGAYINLCWQWLLIRELQLVLIYQKMKMKDNNAKAKDGNWYYLLFPWNLAPQIYTCIDKWADGVSSTTLFMLIFCFKDFFQGQMYHAELEIKDITESTTLLYHN